MTDKQIVELLKTIKNSCFLDNLPWGEECRSCQFYIDNEKHKGCQLTWLIGNMSCEPQYWNIERLKEILEQ